MRLQAGIRYAFALRGRAILVLATSVMLMLIALSAMLPWGGRHEDRSAAKSAAIQAATAQLEANGCQVRVFAISRGLVPFAEFAPSFLQRSLIKTEFGHVVELRTAQLTDDNIDLINRYPKVDVLVLGSMVADASLLKLSKLAHLNELRIETTAASQAGLSALKVSRPNLEIDLCDHQGHRLSTFELPRQFEWGSPQQEHTDQILRASGCLVQHEALARSSLPDDLSDSALRRMQRQCYMEVTAKVITPGNIELMNQYPFLGIAAQGPDFTDVELAAMAGVQPLVTLWLENTAVTDDGMNALHTARPEMNIVIGSREKPVRLFRPTPARAALPATPAVK